MTEVYPLLIHTEKYTLSLQFLPFTAIISWKTSQGCHTHGHTSLLGLLIAFQDRKCQEEHGFYVKQPHTTTQHPLFTMMVKEAKPGGRFVSREAEIWGTDPRAAEGDQP